MLLHNEALEFCLYIIPKCFQQYSRPEKSIFTEGSGAMVTTMVAVYKDSNSFDSGLFPYIIKLHQISQTDMIAAEITYGALIMCFMLQLVVEKKKNILFL